MEQSEYQARVVGELRRLLLGLNGCPKTLDREGTGSRVVVEEVRLEDSSSEGMVVVLYRDLRRPECLFGWRMEAMEPEEEPEMEPELWTTIVWANFLEHVIGTPYGLPAKCSEEGITWTS
jgi:hypothetical protein